MGAGMKDIKRRIKSVESTMQITKAMELVASSKLRKAKERAEASRPYFNMLYRAVSEIAYDNTDFSSVYTRKREVKRSLFIVIAGDRGLAGGYNSNIFKLAQSEMAGKDASVIAIGKKACEYYERSGYPLVAGYANIAENINITTASEIASTAIKMFREKETDEVYLLFTQFVTALTQTPTALKVLPLSFEKGRDLPGRREQVIYEPSAEAVFDSIVPSYAAGMVLGAVVESFASEQGARRTAMESANDNAEEMIGELSLRYNRARQGAITQEITEIVSGAQAAR